MTVPQGPNQRWSLDFVSDVLADGRRFRALGVVDDFTRECLALVVDTSLSGRRVVRELDCIVELRGAPLLVVGDNGTELTSHAGSRHRLALHRARQAGAERARREPDRPVARRMPQRACLSGLAAARRIIEAWRADYNAYRPHTSLRGLTPNELAARYITDHNQNGVWL
jgi:putative transposase